MENLEIGIIDVPNELVELIGINLLNLINVKIYCCNTLEQPITQFISQNKFSLIIVFNDHDQKKFTLLIDYLQHNQTILPILMLNLDNSKSIKVSGGYPLIQYLQVPFSDEEFLVAASNLTSEFLENYKIFNRQYTPISISTLIKIRDISVPLYVELNENKFIKIFNPDVRFDVTEFDRYRRRGVETLYVKSTDYKALIEEYKKKLISETLVSTFKNNAVEDFLVATSIQEVLNRTLSNFGIDKKTEALAKKNIQFVKAIADRETDLNDLLRWVNTNDYQYEYMHSILICYLAAIIGSRHQFENKFATEYISLAAFFHDASLDIYQIENENSFREAIKLGSKSNKIETDLVRQHPTASAIMIRAWRSCPEDVATVIENHCEQPDGKGFPVGKTSASLDELSSCFIFCEDVTHKLLSKKSKSAVQEYLKSKEAYYSSGYFKKYYDTIVDYMIHDHSK
jgi:HD-GYP domain-containing protein (c-di-GMP phosphodiesterase class II)